MKKLSILLSFILLIVLAGCAGNVEGEKNNIGNENDAVQNEAQNNEGTNNNEETENIQANQEAEEIDPSEAGRKYAGVSAEEIEAELGLKEDQAIVIDEWPEAYNEYVDVYMDTLTTYQDDAGFKIDFEFKNTSDRPVHIEFGRMSVDYFFIDEPLYILDVEVEEGEQEAATFIFSRQPDDEEVSVNQNDIIINFYIRDPDTKEELDTFRVWLD